MCEPYFVWLAITLSRHAAFFNAETKTFPSVINFLWWSGGTIHAYCTADRGLNLTGRVYVHFCFRL